MKRPIYSTVLIYVQKAIVLAEGLYKVGPKRFKNYMKFAESSLSNTNFWKFNRRFDGQNTFEHISFKQESISYFNSEFHRHFDITDLYILAMIFIYPLKQQRKMTSIEYFRIPE